MKVHHMKNIPLLYLFLRGLNIFRKLKILKDLPRKLKLHVAIGARKLKVMFWSFHRKTGKILALVIWVMRFYPYSLGDNNNPFNHLPFPLSKRLYRLAKNECLTLQLADLRCKQKCSKWKQQLEAFQTVHLQWRWY